MKLVPMMLNIRARIAALAAALSLCMAVPATAAPVIGAQLFWSGGDVKITVLPATAGFISELTLFSASPDIFIALNTDVGAVVTLSAATLDAAHDVGDELVFGIFVTDTSDTFLMGPGSRNADGLEHAAVDALGGGVFIVGFEDLFGGGDLDYDDNVFRFEGGISVTPNPTPEPGSLLLVGAALLGFAGYRRARAG